jgi:phage shock protein A
VWLHTSHYCLTIQANTHAIILTCAHTISLSPNYALQVAESEVTLEAAQSETAELKDALQAVELTAATSTKEARHLSAQLSTATAELAALRAQAAAAAATASTAATVQQGALSSEDSYQMFKGLVGMFEQERQLWSQKSQENSLLLRCAVEDVLHLQQKNSELELQLKKAIAWEFSSA